MLFPASCKFITICSILFAAMQATSQPYCWLWQKNAGTPADEGGNSIALHASSVYNAGTFRSASITIDDSVFNNRGARDIYLVKRDNKGNLLWAKTLGGTMNESVCSIDTDNDGGIYIGGTFSGSMQADNIVNSNGGTDIFVAKYNASGVQQWIKAFGSPGNDSLTGLVANAGGRIRVAGIFSGTIIIGSYTLTAASGNAFTASLQREGGNVVFAKNYSIPSSTRYTRTDKNGNIYHAGNSYVNVSMGNTTLLPGCQPLFASTSVFWAAKLDTASNLVWLKDLAPCDNLVNLGYYRDYLDFYVDRNGLLYFSFIEGRWPSVIGPSPGDPYLSLIAVFSTDGNLIERGGLSFNSFLGSNSIFRYILDAANQKVLLRNVTFGQLEYVTDIVTQNSITNALAYVQAQNYASGVVAGADQFYFTGKTFLNKLGKELEANAGVDKLFCSTSATPIALGGNPAASCGVQPYTYAWAPATGLSATNVANPSINLSSITDSIAFMLTITDAAGSIRRDTVKIINAVPPTPSITPVNNTLVTNAISGIQWFFNGQSIPNATGPVISANQPGQYTVQVTNNYGCTAMSAAYEVMITEMKLIAFSSAGLIRIQYSLPGTSRTSVELINIATGVKNNLQQNVLQPAGIYTLNANKAGLAKGAYIVRVITEQKIVSVKFIIL
jgi:hypothetical protein